VKVIVGLGNPGRRYSKTRHNLGFMVLDRLASIYDIKLNRKGFDSEWGEGYIEGEKVILMKPQTFMNLSGKAVKGMLKKEKAESSDLLIFYDDMDLRLGKIRIRTRGGAGGHKGVRSIIDNLGTDNFIRVRIGIGRPEDNKDAEPCTIRCMAEDYVLSPFKKSEMPLVKEMMLRAVEAGIMIIKDGITSAMNKYNPL